MVFHNVGIRLKPGCRLWVCVAIVVVWLCAGVTAPVVAAPSWTGDSDDSPSKRAHAADDLFDGHEARVLVDEVEAPECPTLPPGWRVVDSGQFFSLGEPAHLDGELGIELPVCFSERLVLARLGESEGLEMVAALDELPGGRALGYMMALPVRRMELGELVARVAAADHPWLWSTLLANLEEGAEIAVADGMQETLRQSMPTYPDWALRYAQALVWLADDADYWRSVSADLVMAHPDFIRTDSLSDLPLDLDISCLAGWWGLQDVYVVKALVEEIGPEQRRGLADHLSPIVIDSLMRQGRGSGDSGRLIELVEGVPCATLEELRQRESTFVQSEWPRSRLTAIVQLRLEKCGLDGFDVHTDQDG